MVYIRASDPHQEYVDPDPDTVEHPDPSPDPGADPDPDTDHNNLKNISRSDY